VSTPLIVSVPHRLGKEEALRRLKNGLGQAGAPFGHLFSVERETWIDNHLQFRISALGQAASGSIDVADDHVRLEVFLPWLLAKLAETLQPLIRKEGTLLLEKK
jgi:Putative polyhydroxyalkanoic acid system protein (PHA_gran_rgn)